MAGGVVFLQEDDVRLHMCVDFGERRLVRELDDEHTGDFDQIGRGGNRWIRLRRARRFSLTFGPNSEQVRDAALTLPRACRARSGRGASASGSFKFRSASIPPNSATSYRSLF